jgi:hypothetical protein
MVKVIFTFLLVLFGFCAAGIARSPHSTLPISSCIGFETRGYQFDNKTYTYTKQVNASDKCSFKFNTKHGSISKYEVISEPKLGKVSLIGQAEFMYQSGSQSGSDRITWKLCKVLDNGQEGCAFINYIINIM